MPKRMFYIVILCATVSFVLLSCKKEQETKSGITGRVTAVEGSGAGALVRLYKAPEPFEDASVWSVTDENDAVGFAYGLDFAFDHRVVSSIMADTADGDGDFQFEQVVGGDYVVVAERVGQTWAQYKLITTGGGDVQVGELRIPRMVTYSISQNNTNITQNTTWESGTHYVLIDHTFVQPGVTLTIEPGAIVRPSGNKALNIRGTLVCNGTPDNFIIFAAHEVINRDPDEWRELKFHSGATPPNITYTEFRNGEVAISTDVDSGLVEYCHISRFIAEGISAALQPPVVRRCVFDRVATGLYAAYTDGIHIDRNVFQTCDQFAIVLNTVENGEVSCNWFRDCGTDSTGSGGQGVIKLDWAKDFEIRNNFFETSSYAMDIGSRVDSTVYIHHNEFDGMNHVLDIGVTEERRGPSNPVFKYNCLLSLGYDVVFIHCSQHNYLDIDASRNAWGTLSVSTIQGNYINDRLDNPVCPVVTIEPLMSSCSQIQTESGVAAGLCQ